MNTGKTKGGRNHPLKSSSGTQVQKVLEQLDFKTAVFRNSINNSVCCYLNQSVVCYLNHKFDSEETYGLYQMRHLPNLTLNSPQSLVLPNSFKPLSLCRFKIIVEALLDPCKGRLSS